MKKAVFFLFYMFLIVSCNKDDDGCRGVDCLPPKTQTGENTFGCLLDGKPFILKGGVNPLDCVYQLIDGKWYFQLQGNNEDENFLGRAIIINTIDKEIEEGASYDLVEEKAGNAYAIFSNNTIFSFTSSENPGELYISKLDMSNQIVSGTFSFEIVDNEGNLRRITEGRFDMRFTR
ncbi:MULTISPECIES: hypothetical protein [unclassified Leeuwenhoekiella]|uniref:hypothetical protein n=1 Tax=unclassified Leeuwenhoekiella TaxID=2615029 RepID=UPI0025C4B304|nr:MULTISPECIES: hypothetical protein [unclassified Leeuwenhoekiella]|tara:strand:+ start:28097 stop:28624 length:528 start_codon:yes stop_codon:yes gene_type:complete